MRWRRRRIAPIPDPPPTVRVLPPPPPAAPPAPCHDDHTCPDGCTPNAPCILCRALGHRSTP